MADERERQTSNKAGLRSLGKKMDGTRHGFEEHPGSRQPAGAFGQEEKMRGSGAHPGKDASLRRMKKSS